MKPYTQALCLLALAVVFLWGGISQPADAQTNAVVISGEQKLWHRITLTFSGPFTSETALPNPFTDYRLNVTFRNGDQTLVVPGFYAADGDAANTGATSGDKWRVHFTPNRTGTWTYEASFRTEFMIATSLDPNAGVPASFNGASGSFTVGPTDKAAPDFRAKGILRYTGAHHMQFEGTGEYYLKGGADSPENFLGYVDFDGTYDTGGIIDDFLHVYAPHINDWQPGDPSWGANQRGKGIIGAVNYLASQGVNSIYLITYNIDGGDGADTWPWITHTERYRFDVSKLAQWEIVFGHMTANGIQIHLLTQENENDQELGGVSGINDIRRLYYRELVARFAHHPVLQWNLGEENDNTDIELGSFAAYIRALDPYNHPLVLHTYYGLGTTFGENTRPGSYYYETILANSPTLIEGTSIQGNADTYNIWAVTLRERSARAGHRWVIYGDEQGPPVERGATNTDVLRKRALWGNLMGGGAGVEWYFGYQDDFGDVQSEDFRLAEPLWEDTRHALDFFQAHLPFWRMAPNNDLSNADYTLAAPGEVYAVYMDRRQTVRLDLTGYTGTFEVLWYNPREGGALQTGSVTQVVGGDERNLGNPPGGGSNDDWAILVRVLGLEQSVVPMLAPNGTIQATPSVDVQFMALPNATAYYVDVYDSYSVKVYSGVHTAGEICNGGVCMVNVAINGVILDYEVWTVPQFGDQFGAWLRNEFNVKLGKTSLRNTADVIPLQPEITLDFAPVYGADYHIIDVYRPGLPVERYTLSQADCSPTLCQLVVPTYGVEGRYGVWIVAGVGPYFGGWAFSDVALDAAPVLEAQAVDVLGSASGELPPLDTSEVEAPVDPPGAGLP